MLRTIEKKICLYRHGRYHEAYSEVVDFETEDFQDIVIDGNPNYCGRDFETRESIAMIGESLIRPLAELFNLGNESANQSTDDDSNPFESEPSGNSYEELSDDSDSSEEESSEELNDYTTHSFFQSPRK